MGRDAFATKEEVYEAIERLHETGHVSAALLVEELGGGSRTTMANHLRAWRADQEEQSLTELPEPIRKLIEGGLFSISQAVLQALQEQKAAHANEIARLNRSHTRQVRKHARKLQDRNQQLERLNRQVSTLETEVRVLREKGRKT